MSFHEGEPTGEDSPEIVDPLRDRVRDLLEQYEIIPNTKSRDQHFLVSSEALEGLVSGAELESGDTVIEVGAGLGTITERIAPLVERVYAVESDERFAPVLNELSARHQNVVVVMRSILDMPWPAADKMISNLPYTVSVQILEQLAQEKTIGRASLIAGGRMVENLTNEQITSRTGLIGQAYFQTSQVVPLAGSDFFPEGGPGSAMISLERRSKKKGVDRSLLTFANKLLFQPNARVQEALSDIIGAGQKITTRNWENARTVSSLHLSPDLLKTRLSALDDEHLRQVIVALRGLR